MPDLIPSGKPVGVNRHPAQSENVGSRVGARDDETLPMLRVYFFAPLPEAFQFLLPLLPSEHQ